MSHKLGGIEDLHSVKIDKVEGHEDLCSVKVCLSCCWWFPLHILWLAILTGQY